MPYQRQSEKAQQPQEPQAPEPSPAMQQGAEPQVDLQKKMVERGAPDLNKPQGSAREGFRMAQELVRPGQGAAMGGDIEATPAEQAEYERAVAALGKVLYENEDTSAAVVRQLTPREKVGSVAKASMLVIQQLDAKFDFDEVVIPQLTQEAVDRVIDLYENTQGEEFSEQEAQGALGATWEGIMEMYGIDEDSYAELTAGMGDAEFSQYEQQYKQFLGDA